MGWSSSLRKNYQLLIKLEVSMIPSMFIVGEVLVSADILTEYFACDIEACHGQCCEEGNAGAPVSLDEVAEIESQLDALWPHMSATAQAVVEKQGVAYPDPEGELVTSICHGRDCCFRGPQGCLLRERPISCYLYPIREKQLTGGGIALNYDRWSICKAAVLRGRKEGIHVYQFLRAPLIRRFGEGWYQELQDIAEHLPQ